MFFNIPFSAISLTCGFFAGIAFSCRVYRAHLEFKKPFTSYLLWAAINWTIIAGMFGLTPILFPGKYQLWQVMDSIAHIVFTLTMAFLYRFFLSLTRSEWSNKVFVTVLFLGGVFTLIDFLYPRTPYVAPPGVIVWNNHPLVGYGLTSILYVVILMLTVYFFTKKEVKDFLVKVRFLLFAAFFGFLGFGGGIITFATTPGLVLFGDILLFIGALAMLTVALVRFLSRTD